MMDDNDMTYDSQDGSFVRNGGSHDTHTSYYAASRKPYVRQPRPRRTAEAIDNLEEDDTYATSYAHDSNVSVRGASPLSGRVYSRSRSDMGKLQRNLHYGQYLEIPKGRREIFTSKNRSRQIRARLWLVAIVSLLVIILVLTLSLVM